MKLNILIFGATSAIAHALARVYAKEGNSFFLVGRDAQKLNSVRQDLLAYGAQRAETHACDLNEISLHRDLFQKALEIEGKIDRVLIAHGILGDQRAAEEDWAQATDILHTNFTSQVSLGLKAAEILRRQRSGSLAVIGSVAGDRGRQSNYLYGSAKAGIEAFLSGLRNHLSHDQVSVTTIKPGFISTPMTRTFKKGLLWAEPHSIAPGIVRAIENGRDVIYVPWFWRWIMLIIRLIPERIFKRLKL